MMNYRTCDRSRFDSCPYNSSLSFRNLLKSKTDDGICQIGGHRPTQSIMISWFHFQDILPRVLFEFISVKPFLFDCLAYLFFQVFILHRFRATERYRFLWSAIELIEAPLSPNRKFIEFNSQRFVSQSYG